MKVKSLSCVWLCNPMDHSLPGSAVHGIFQARTLEWAAISFSSRSSHPRDWTLVSCIAHRCFTVWATREGLPIPSPGNLSGSPGIEPVFPTLEGRFFTAEPPGNPKILMHIHIFTEIFESFSLLVKEWPVWQKSVFVHIYRAKGHMLLFCFICWNNLGQFLILLSMIVLKKNSILIFNSVSFSILPCVRHWKKIIRSLKSKRSSCIYCIACLYQKLVDPEKKAVSIIKRAFSVSNINYKVV